MNGARARPYIRASRSTSAAGIPVISAVRPGANRGSTSRSSRSNPSVSRAMYARSQNPSRTSTCITPRASAASVPIRGARCQSACAAVRLRRGSMTTSGVPAARTFSTRAQKCTFVVTRSALQAITRSESSTVSGSAPPTAPSVACHAASEQLSQTVPGMSRVVPSAWNSAMGSQRLNCPWWAL
jgi:hypothetical protein